MGADGNGEGGAELPGVILPFPKFGPTKGKPFKPGTIRVVGGAPMAVPNATDAPIPLRKEMPTEACDAFGDGGSSADGSGVESGPHLSGKCVCGACGHEWVGVAPTGVTTLECPQCRRMWGTFKHAVEPDWAWRCSCGERLFWITPKGVMCRQCGRYQVDWV